MALAPMLGLAQEPFSGEVDLRNRLVFRNEYPVFRSIVNLNRGPRLFGIQSRYEGDKDKISLTGNSLGDPNSMVRIDARRSEVYEATFSYRTIAYFNNLPSYGNPLLAQGVSTSQRFLDLSRRQYDFDLRLRPDSRVIPFVNVLRTAGGGNGITPFVGSGDEFPVPARLQDSLTTVRGGVELRSQKWFGNVEQGWTNYTDQQDLDNTSRLQGNRIDNLVLDRIRERYHAEGTGWFTRSVVQGHPFERLSFTGHLIYSRPKMETSYSLDAQGVFRDPNTLRPYTSLLESSFANASQPRTSGAWTTEYRPWKRWRARHTWVSDMYRISSASPTTAVLTQQVDPARGILELQYHQSEAEMTGEFGKHLTVRGGHRYIHSNAELPPANLTFPESTNRAQIRRHAGLGGATLTLWKGRWQTHGSYEWSPGGRTYFRMGLLNYRKAHVLTRLRVSDRLRITASQRELQNDNMGDTASNHITTVNAEWTPGAAGQRVTLVGGYAREYMISRATFANPTNLQIQPALFDDRLNHFNGYADVRLRRGVQWQAGGALSHSEGSRPTRFYTPQSQLVVASNSRVSGVMEWRWYRYRAVDEFRAHTVSMGIRVRFGARAAN
ncbi:hypothetical protein F183_A31050 [Bryobacterales bacterium F-183]|nr:hypothetical protein F183_A31050 [Bryobacterales bacterium F-183]